LIVSWSSSVRAGPGRGTERLAASLVTPSPAPSYRAEQYCPRPLFFAEITAHRPKVAFLTGPRLSVNRKQGQILFPVFRSFLEPVFLTTVLNGVCLRCGKMGKQQDATRRSSGIGSARAGPQSSCLHDSANNLLRYPEFHVGRMMWAESWRCSRRSTAVVTRALCFVADRPDGGKQTLSFFGSGTDVPSAPWEVRQGAGSGQAAMERDGNRSTDEKVARIERRGWSTARQARGWNRKNVPRHFLRGIGQRG